jgi:ribosomal protein S12 methylthiotransferase accessory factor
MTDAPKGFRGGTHRTVSPDETLSRVLPFAPVMRITRIANITGLDILNIPVWIACRPNARSLAISQGKGIDHASAKASALMESIEAFHAERIALPLKYGSYNELRFTHSMVDVDGLARTTRPFDRNTPIFWIESTDLVTGGGVWVPYEIVHLNYTLPPLPGSGFFLATSNGLASGNHRLEAISHGLCEVIERDAATLWTLAGERAAATRVDPRTIDDAAARDLLERYDRAQVGVGVWDATSDVGIPTFVCFIADRVYDPLRPIPIARGSGCHPAREIAVLRALTEAAQSRLTVISGSRDDLTDARNAARSGPDESERSRRAICDGRGAREFRAIPSYETKSIDEDVSLQLEHLAAAGMEQVLVVDLTRREFRIPVVRVIVPGLEALHEAPGYSAGARARRAAEATA